MSALSASLYNFISLILLYSLLMFFTNWMLVAPHAILVSKAFTAWVLIGKTIRDHQMLSHQTCWTNKFFIIIVLWLITTENTELSAKTFAGINGEESIYLFFYARDVLQHRNSSSTRTARKRRKSGNKLGNVFNCTGVLFIQDTLWFNEDDRCCSRL